MQQVPVIYILHTPESNRMCTLVPGHVLETHSFCFCLSLLERNYSLSLAHTLSLSLTHMRTHTTTHTHCSSKAKPRFTRPVVSDSPISHLLVPSLFLASLFSSPSHSPPPPPLILDSVATVAKPDNERARNGERERQRLNAI